MRVLRVLLCVALSAISMDAQRLGPPEKRPKLATGADTNDASAYFVHATRNLEGSPAEAAAAFYWAARLDPSSADALDGRRAGLLMRTATTLKLYIEGNRRARESKEYKSIDSLQLRALRLDPLYYRKNDRTMLLAYYRNLLRGENPTASFLELDRVIIEYLEDGSPYMRGWLAYGSGRMEQALADYAIAIKRTKFPGRLRLERARVMAVQGRMPDALPEFRLALQDLRKSDDAKDEHVVFYDSKALVEHSMALVFGSLGQLDSAKAALGRAITEDLSYFPAHIELGKLALTAKDMVTAISELALAAELAPDEPYVHFLQGSTLVTAGQFTEALAPLRTAIALEPMYAAPVYSLGVALERNGDPVGARDAYSRFLAMSARRDPRRDLAERRLEALPPASKP